MVGEGTIYTSCMDEADRLFDWAAFYGVLSLILVVLGVGAAVGYKVVLPPRSESASVVVAKPGIPLPPNQFQLLSKAVFRSAAVFEPAIEELGLEKSPQNFLSEDVDLLPIPSTTAVIILGRSRTAESAEDVAQVMAKSFVRAFEDRTGADLETFGRPTARLRPGGLSLSVAVFLGATSGFWLALALAIFHYKVKRPVLSLRRALSVSGTSSATMVDGKGWSFLGILRADPLRGYPLGPVDGGSAILYAHAATAERDLEGAALREPGSPASSSDGRVTLIWAR